MRGKPPKRVYTQDELKKHKKGKEYVSKKLAEQEAMEEYSMLDINDVPESLGDCGMDKWFELVPLLHELPVAELDKGLITAYCSLYEDFVGYRTGELDISYNQFLSIVKEMRMLSGQLGMTMSSRLDLVTPDAETEQDAFMELIKGG